GVAGCVPVADVAGALLQEREHLGALTEIGVTTRLVDHIAGQVLQVPVGGLEGVLEPSPLVGVVVRNPNRTAGQCAGSTEELTLLEDHHVEAQQSTGYGRGHAPVSGADDHEVVGVPQRLVFHGLPAQISRSGEEPAWRPARNPKVQLSPMGPPPDGYRNPNAAAEVFPTA